MWIFFCYCIWLHFPSLIWFVPIPFPISPMPEKNTFALVLQTFHGYYAECDRSCEGKAHECKKPTTSASLTRFIRRTNQRSTSCVRKAKFISHRLPIFEFFRGDVFCNLREKQAKQEVIHNNKIPLALLRTIPFKTLKMRYTYNKESKLSLSPKTHKIFESGKRKRWQTIFCHQTKWTARMAWQKSSNKKKRL